MYVMTETSKKISQLTKMIVEDTASGELRWKFDNSQSEYVAQAHGLRLVLTYPHGKFVICGNQNVKLHPSSFSHIEDVRLNINELQAIVFNSKELKSLEPNFVEWFKAREVKSTIALNS